MALKDETCFYDIKQLIGTETGTNVVFAASVFVHGYLRTFVKHLQIAKLCVTCCLPLAADCQKKSKDQRQEHPVLALHTAGPVGDS